MCRSESISFSVFDSNGDEMSTRKKDTQTNDEEQYYLDGGDIVSCLLIITWVGAAIFNIWKGNYYPDVLFLLAILFVTLGIFFFHRRTKKKEK